MENEITTLSGDRFNFIAQLRLVVSASLVLSGILVFVNRILALVIHGSYLTFITLVLLSFHSDILALNSQSFILFCCSLITILSGSILLYKQPRAGQSNEAGVFRTQILGLGLVVMLAFTTTELLLRGQGGQPGVFGHDGFKPVNSLVVFPDLMADEYGIQSFTPETATKVSELIANEFSETDSVEWNDLSSGPWRLVRDLKSCRDEKESTNYSRYIEKLSGSKNLDVVDSAVIQSYMHPLNKNGFRSIPFEDHKTNKTKVLLLGDSFTWGWNAENITNSFADHLTSMGYAVYNSGISATDPAQYQAVAEKYIEVIKPDVVIVNFYMVNDVMYHLRTPKEHQIYSWETNAGVFYSYPAGVYITDVDSAYDFVLGYNSIPNTGFKSINRLMASTVITTRIWNALAQLGLGYFLFEDERKLPTPENPIVDHHTDAISAVCKANDATLLISVIPDNQDLNDEAYLSLFGEIKPVRISGLNESHFNPKDRHFNDVGHEKYAGFLATKIDSVLATD